jgi:hypothetical protein
MIERSRPEIARLSILRWRLPFACSTHNLKQWTSTRSVRGEHQLFLCTNIIAPLSGSGVIIAPSLPSSSSQDSSGTDSSLDPLNLHRLERLLEALNSQRSGRSHRSLNYAELRGVSAQATAPEDFSSTSTHHAVESTMTRLVEFSGGLLQQLEPLKRGERLIKSVDGQMEAVYVVGRKRGRGSYGIVHECTKMGPEQAPQPLVVKISKLAGASQVIVNSHRPPAAICSVLTKRFPPSRVRQKDSIILRGLGMPHTPSFVDFFKDSRHGVWCLVMEPACHGSLLDAVTEANYSDATAVEWVAQMLEAYMAVENAGVIHRDLFPRNWLVTKDPTDPTSRVLLTDFGVGQPYHPFARSTGVFQGIHSGCH